MRWRLVLLAGLAVACSPNKDRFANRVYHRLTARDNGWFNANEKLKEVVADLEHHHVDDYDEVLPLFIYGTEDEAKASASDLEKCIEKCSLVIERHSMDVKGKERNKWIDDAYFVIGRSHFYKHNYFDAQRIFDYIGRRFKGEDKQMEAKVWLARTLIEVEQYARAQSVLDEVKEEKELPKHFPHDELAAVQADLDLHRGKVDDAIIELEHAVDITKDRQDRVRWAFILAQLYQLKGQEEKAIAQYAHVVRMNPPYELAFHAQIFQALAFNKGNSEVLRKKLNKMLHDDKHVDHYDMIHYALADLDLKDNKEEEAIAQLKLSCLVSTTDRKQKAKSYLKLADLYFDDRAYADAQKYYDSTSTVLDETNPRYDEVRTRAEVLGDLVEQLDIIALEDSLQALAGLSKEEREQRVKGLIEQREKQEEERAAKEAAAREVAESTPVKPATPSNSSDRGQWYFYNAQQIARGATEFRKKWGERKLEDDWRRSDKSGAALATGTEEEEDGETAEKGEEAKEIPDWKDPDFYMKDIPKDTAALMASDARICEALYKSGMIYKEKLKDVDNAIESFENLNSRFADCSYTPESYYQMYRIYLEKERTGNFIDFSGATSKHYADIIMERWPDSEFARLVQDPDRLEEAEAHRQMEAAEYDQVYHRFKQHDLMGVITACNDVISNEPQNHLLPKYYMLKAMAVGGMHELTAFRTALNEVKDKFPGSDEAQAASDILAVLDNKDQASGTASDKAAGKDGASNYQLGQGPHYIAIIYPSSAGPIEDAKTKISNFDQRYFAGKNILIENTILNDDSQVILLRLFADKAAAMAYYQQFLNDVGMLAGINDQGYPIFAISPDNYSQLYRNKDVAAYTAFFNANYLKTQ
ncbi:MAG: tetratricopeptide repeat protein [Flavobacteriales bacterium]|nr:tetratricopeptide repeat protein [Flavobacteriales bacterium]MCB9193549.1 tetratricopeptide repeat protein [Flavobacteriales bacterium]